MNDQRPTRWPCSADSSRNAGPSPRSFRNAETGVSQSAMNVWVIASAVSAAAAIEHLRGVGEGAVAPGQQHGQVEEHVGRLVVDAVVGLLARRADDLLGLLLDLGAGQVAVVEQADDVGARRALRGALGDRALER